MLNNKRILLTGASGFAGSHMLKHLYLNTSAVIVCPFTYTHGGHPGRIPSLLGQIDSSRIELLECDIATSGFMNKMLNKEFDVIINFASESHVDRSISNPHEFVSNNIDLMINLLEFARNSKNLSLFLHISTDEVFGSLPSEIKNREWDRPHFPSNPYSASKSAQESLLISFFKTFNTPVSIANITNMIGEAQNQEKFLPKVISKILHNETINVDTTLDGKIGGRKYIHVEDVAIGILKIIGLDTKHKLSEGGDGLPSKFHISGTTELSNLEIVELVSECLGKKATIVFSPSPRQGYDRQYQLSSEKLRKTGWKEEKPISERIRQVVNWTIKNKEWLEIDHIAN